MIRFRMALAGIPFEAGVMFEQTRQMCRDYFTEAQPLFSVATSPEQIDAEREAARRTAELEGHSCYPFSDAELESTALYRAIAEQMLSHSVLLMHASAIAVDGEGFLFLARSGTGKSTHTRLWRQLFGERAVMVNDDKPMVRCTEDGVYVCGTPWDGKHHLSSNIQVKVKGVCLLERAKENHIQKISPAEGFPGVYIQSYRSENPEKLVLGLGLMEQVCTKAGLYRLGCNMEPEAAQTAWAGMGGKE